MARSLYVPSKHLVMATETAPAGFRPGNQARLVKARSTNPIYAHTDAGAFMPGMGECRSGNGSSDLGLGGKWLNNVTVSGLGAFKRDPAQLARELAAMNARLNAPAMAAQAAAAERLAQAAALRAAQEAATEYQDEKGNPITKAQYDAMMAPKPVVPEVVYKDSRGAVITKAQYEALIAAANRPKPKPVVKKLAKSRGVHGMGAFFVNSAQVQQMLQEAATEYQDASGKPITKAQYDAMMAEAAKPVAPPQPVYKDAQGTVITKAQYDALIAAAAAPKPKPRPKPQVVVKRLKGKGMHGLGEMPSTTNLLCLAGAAFVAYKLLTRKKSR